MPNKYDGPSMDYGKGMPMGHESDGPGMHHESAKQERKDLMKDNPVVKDASGKRKMTKEDFKKLGMKEAGERPKDARRYGKGFKKA